MITLANSLDPDQARKIFLKDFFQKVKKIKISRRQKKREKLPSMQ